MKIKRVEVYKADLLLKRAFRIALGEIEVARNVFIRIDTDAGLSGWGEGSPFTPIVGETQATCLEVARDLGRLILGTRYRESGVRANELLALQHNDPLCVRYGAV